MAGLKDVEEAAESDERGEWEETRPERKGRAECPKVQVLEDLCWSVLECPAQSQTSVPRRGWFVSSSFSLHSHGFDFAGRSISC